MKMVMKSLCLALALCCYALGQVEVHPLPETQATDLKIAILIDEEGNEQKVLYQEHHGYALYEGDIILGKIEPGNFNKRGFFIASTHNRWQGTVIPYVIDPSLSNASVAAVEAAIAHWADHTAIRLVPRQGEPDFIRFTDGDGCTSHVGRQGGGQEVVLSSGCGTGAAIHEIGHAVGLFHEHTRSDRGNHIRVNWGNISDGNAVWFQARTSNGIFSGNYDLQSVMHYDSFAFSRNGLPTIELLNGGNIARAHTLSAGDIAAVATMYGAVPKPTLTVRTDACWGRNEASWTAVPNADRYELYVNSSNTTQGAGLYYSGSSTRRAINVSRSSFVWVRACSGNDCGEFSNSDVAFYVNGCL